ncbi:MAG: hypothetical protein J6T10_11340 [Methanobrevibacter sp.]|nr:hypothetical protein [Methanobrevibacter sp.]
MYNKNFSPQEFLKIFLDNIERKNLLFEFFLWQNAFESFQEIKEKFEIKRNQIDEINSALEFLEKRDVCKIDFHDDYQDEDVKIDFFDFLNLYTPSNLNIEKEFDYENRIIKKYSLNGVEIGAPIGFKHEIKDELERMQEKSNEEYFKKRNRTKKLVELSKDVNEIWTETQDEVFLEILNLIRKNW